MTMPRVKLKNVNRPKAFLGALINGVGAIANAYGQYQNAKAEAEAIEKAGQLQADALLKQNENAAKLQQQYIDFTRNENQRMINSYLNAAMQQGQQNVDNRLRAGRIAVRNGGSIKRNPSLSLRGKRNKTIEGEGGELFMINSVNPNAFKVTDGGGVVYLGETNDGNQLYQIVGDTHNQTHTAPDGKRKTGVGIKFEDGVDAAFLSKHNVNGMNPTQEVMNGMSPELAFELQEESKTPIRRRLRCGGRHKARFGDWFGFDKNDTFKKWAQRNSKNADWYGTGATFVGNLLGWGVNAIGNGLSAKYQKAGVNRYADIMRDAYSRLKTIDLNDIKLNHGIAALQAPIVSNNQERAALERDYQRSLKTIGDSYLSSAAAQNRRDALGIKYQDASNQIASDEEKRRNEILARNMDAINEMTRANLAIDKENSDLKLRAAQFNTETQNNAILGAAEADANRYYQLGNIRGKRSLANWSGFGNVFTNTGKYFTDSVNMRNKLRYEFASALAGAQNKETIDNIKSILEEYGIII